MIRGSDSLYYLLLRSSVIPILADNITENFKTYTRLKRIGKFIKSERYLDYSTIKLTHMVILKDEHKGLELASIKISIAKYNLLFIL